MFYTVKTVNSRKKTYRDRDLIVVDADSSSCLQTIAADALSSSESLKVKRKPPPQRVYILYMHYQEVLHAGLSAAISVSAIEMGESSIAAADTRSFLPSLTFIGLSHLAHLGAGEKHRQIKRYVLQARWVV